VRGFFHFLIEISQSIKTFHHFQTQKVSTMSRFLQCRDFSTMSRFLNNVEISQQCQDFSTNLDCVSTNLDNLDKNLDWKVSILKISTEKKKFGLDCCENLDTLKKLVSTLRTISISIGLDCRDPQAYNKTMTD
jgi:hypothetical protein